MRYSLPLYQHQGEAWNTLRIAALLCGMLLSSAFIGVDVKAQPPGGPPGQSGPKGPPFDVCGLCPCNYFGVPITDACWGEPSGASPVWLPDGPPTLLCVLLQAGVTDLILATSIDTTGARRTCVITGEVFTGVCRGTSATDSNELSALQSWACRICLAEYADAVVNAGFMISGPQPFKCSVYLP